MDTLLKKHHIRVGIGDDAALLTERMGDETVVSSDQFLEGVHFGEGKHPPEAVGYKALVRAASDLAAMGAEARAFLLNLALPAEKTDRWLDGFLGGLRVASRVTGAALVGGDLTRSKKVQISVVVIGRVKSGRAILRSGAKASDLIYVSGRLGGAAMGLRVLREGKAARGEMRSLLRAHLYPPVRLGLGRWLARKRCASAMIDISDGFSMDLHRLCEASGVGARVEAKRMPVAGLSAMARKRMKLGDRAALEYALNGGDDYELLFTVPRDRARRLKSKIEGAELTRVGEIVRGRGVTLVESGKESKLEARGWDPFA